MYPLQRRSPRAGVSRTSAPRMQRQSHAAMRCRIAWEPSAMRRNAVPGQALHERHRRTVISVGVVFTLLLQDREAPPSACSDPCGPNRRCQDQWRCIAIRIGTLFVGGDDTTSGPCGAISGGQRNGSGRKRRRIGRSETARNTRGSDCPGEYHCVQGFRSRVASRWLRATTTAASLRRPVKLSSVFNHACCRDRWLDPHIVPVQTVLTWDGPGTYVASVRNDARCGKKDEIGPRRGV